jgi:hypothetical protein
MDTESQKILERTYYIQSNGTIRKDDSGTGNHITLRLGSNNTLMVKDLLIQGLSLELMMKGLLMTHTEFLTNYEIPTFVSELETKDETGVVDRISNMPGRGVTRNVEVAIEKTTKAVVAVAEAIAAVAAGGAAGVASEAATAAAAAANVAESH